MAAPPVRAMDCKTEVAAAEKFLADLEAEVKQTKEQNRPRVRAFMADGRKLLKEARAECDAASTTLGQAGAMAKVALAQGHLAAARIFIKLD
jgi:hypothetical protein